MSDKVIVVPILSKVLGMAILDFLLIACLLIGNYWVWAKENEKNTIIYQARESSNNNFILTFCTNTSY